MYLVCYPDPGDPCRADAYACEPADTKEEAVELAERLSAQYPGIERRDFMVLDASLAVPLPGKADPRRCPLCGAVVDTGGIDASALGCDEDEGLLLAGTSCPECGAPLDAWFEDTENGPRLDHLGA